MPNYKVNVNGKEFNVALRNRQNDSIEFEIEGQNYCVAIEPVLAEVQSGRNTTALTAPALNHTKIGQASPNEIIAPMPGIIVSLGVKVGDSVSTGQTVAVIEAMKMENNLPSPKNGQVAQVLVKPGQEVSGGQVLIKLA